MKKEQFKSLLKEIIKEVISESEISANDVENDAPVDRTGGKAPTSATDKRWRGKVRMANTLKGDLPADKKTPFFKGPSGSSKYDDQ